MKDNSQIHAIGKRFVVWVIAFIVFFPIYCFMSDGKFLIVLATYMFFTPFIFLTFCLKENRYRDIQVKRFFNIMFNIIFSLFILPIAMNALSGWLNLLDCLDSASFLFEWRFRILYAILLLALLMLILSNIIGFIRNTFKNYIHRC
jgi:hypothetical protein